MTKKEEAKIEEIHDLITEAGIAQFQYGAREKGMHNRLCHIYAKVCALLGITPTKREMMLPPEEYTPPQKMTPAFADSNSCD